MARSQSGDTVMVVQSTLAEAGPVSRESPGHGQGRPRLSLGRNNGMLVRPDGHLLGSQHLDVALQDLEAVSALRRS